jgi:hypothetical protein
MRGKPYARKANKLYRLKSGLKLKVNKIVKASEHKGYFIIKNVVVREDAMNCIIQRPSNMMNLQGVNRTYDRAGHQHFTEVIRNLAVRWPLKGNALERTHKFGDFYKLVAECMGMEDVYVNEHDRIICHSDQLNVSTSVCM